MIDTQIKRLALDELSFIYRGGINWLGLEVIMTSWTKKHVKTSNVSFNSASSIAKYDAPSFVIDPKQKSFAGGLGIS